MMKIRTIDLVLISLNAALYTVLGYMTFLGLFTPIIGVVRFWPGVFVPAVFATLFGPLVGGIGAAIGIFISDMFIHGNALLSLAVGVPANFTMFAIIGYFSRLRFEKKKRWHLFILPLAITVVLVAFSMLLPWTGGETFVWTIIGAISIPAIILIGVLSPHWNKYQAAATLGNAIGSLIVGFGVWGFSQYFILSSGGEELSVMAAYMWTIWTFMNQMPFLIIVVPPILKAAYAAFPSFLSARALFEKP